MSHWQKWLNRRTVSTALIVAMLSAAGCSSWTETQKHNVMVGAASGALIGGAIGCGTAAIHDTRVRRRVMRSAARLDDSRRPDWRQCRLPDGAKARTRSPRPAPVAAAAPPPPPPPPMQQKIVLRGVHFDFNMWNIRPGDAAVLDEAVPTLKTNPGVMIHVNGYCDAIGKPEPNLKLSAARAGSVTDYLMRQGLPPANSSHVVTARRTLSRPTRTGMALTIRKAARRTGASNCCRSSRLN